MDLSNTSWVQRRLINKLSGNTFGTEPTEKVKIGAGSSYGTVGYQAQNKGPDGAEWSILKKMINIIQ